MASTAIITSLKVERIDNLELNPKDRLPLVIEKLQKMKKNDFSKVDEWDKETLAFFKRKISSMLETSFVRNKTVFSTYNKISNQPIKKIASCSTGKMLPRHVYNSYDIFINPKKINQSKLCNTKMRNQNSIQAAEVGREGKKNEKNSQETKGNVKKKNKVNIFQLAETIDKLKEQNKILHSLCKKHKNHSQESAKKYNQLIKMLEKTKREQKDFKEKYEKLKTTHGELSNQYNNVLEKHRNRTMQRKKEVRTLNEKINLGEKRRINLENIVKEKEKELKEKELVIKEREEKILEQKKLIEFKRIRQQKEKELEEKRKKFSKEVEEFEKKYSELYKYEQSFKLFQDLETGKISNNPKVKQDINPFGDILP